MKASILTVVSLCLIALAPLTALAESSFSATGYGLPRYGVDARSAGMAGVALGLPDTLTLDLTSVALWYGPPTARRPTSQP